MKDYFLHFLETAAPDDGELQDAIECALLHGLIHLTGDLAADCATVETHRPQIAALYARQQAANLDAMKDWYAECFRIPPDLAA